jgi:hypothetical protein
MAIVTVWPRAAAIMFGQLSDFGSTGGEGEERWQAVKPKQAAEPALRIIVKSKINLRTSVNPPAR